MEITGKIDQILPAESGEGKNGPWKKQSFILETQEQFPKKVCITVWGDKINLLNYSENSVITASINIESREFNNRWYTDVKAWRITSAQEKSAEAPSGPVSAPPEAEPPLEANTDPVDDLPF